MVPPLLAFLASMDRPSLASMAGPSLASTEGHSLASLGGHSLASPADSPMVSSGERTPVTLVPLETMVSLEDGTLISWEELAMGSTENITLVSLAALATASLVHLILALSAALSPISVDITPDCSEVPFLGSEELIQTCSVDSPLALEAPTPALEELSPDLAEFTLAI